MALTTAARDFITSAIIGTGTFFNSANARLGVGDSTTAFSASQTDLQATTNKLRKVMDATYPSVTGNTIKFQSTFAASEANFSWQEWGVFNAASAGTMLNRVVENNGTKLNGQTWVFQVSLTISVS